MSEPRTTHDAAGTVSGAARGPIPATGDPGIEAFGYHQELKRSLSFTDLLVYGLIFMVPIAPFGIFGSVFQQPMCAREGGGGGLVPPGQFGHVTKGFGHVGDVSVTDGRPSSVGESP